MLSLMDFSNFTVCRERLLEDLSETCAPLPSRGDGRFWDLAGQFQGIRLFSVDVEMYVETGLFRQFPPPQSPLPRIPPQQRGYTALLSVLPRHRPASLKLDNKYSNIHKTTGMAPENMESVSPVAD